MLNATPNTARARTPPPGAARGTKRSAEELVDKTACPSNKRARPDLPTHVSIVTDTMADDLHALRALSAYTGAVREHGSPPPDDEVLGALFRSVSDYYVVGEDPSVRARTLSYAIEMGAAPRAPIYIDPAGQLRPDKDAPAMAAAADAAVAQIPPHFLDSAPDVHAGGHAHMRNVAAAAARKETKLVVLGMGPVAKMMEDVVFGALRRGNTTRPPVPTTFTGEVDWPSLPGYLDTNKVEHFKTINVVLFAGHNTDVLFVDQEEALEKCVAEQGLTGEAAAAKREEVAASRAAMFRGLSRLTGNPVYVLSNPSSASSPAVRFKGSFLRPDLPDNTDDLGLVDMTIRSFLKNAGDIGQLPFLGHSAMRPCIALAEARCKGTCAKVRAMDKFEHMMEVVEDAIFGCGRSVPPPLTIGELLERDFPLPVDLSEMHKLLRDRSEGSLLGVLGDDERYKAQERMLNRVLHAMGATGGDDVTKLCDHLVRLDPTFASYYGSGEDGTPSKVAQVILQRHFKKVEADEEGGPEELHLRTVEEVDKAPKEVEATDNLLLTKAFMAAYPKTAKWFGYPTGIVDAHTIVPRAVVRNKHTLFVKYPEDDVRAGLEETRVVKTGDSYSDEQVVNAMFTLHYKDGCY